MKRPLRISNPGGILPVLCIVFCLLIASFSPVSADAADIPDARRVPVQHFMTDPQGYSAAFWEVAQILMQTWKKELGVTFKHQVEDHEQLIKKMFEGDYDCGILFIMGSPVRLDPGFLMDILFRASCPNFFNRIPKTRCPGGGGPLNFPGYFNPEFNRLLKKQDQAFDYGERKAITDRMLEMAVDDRPALVLLSPNVVHLMNTTRWNNEKQMPGEGLGSVWNVMGIEPTGKDKTLRVGSTYDILTLNPMAVTRTQEYRVMDLLYDTLYRIGLDGKPTKWMVEDTLISDGPNGPKTRLTIKLRGDLKFHDGKSLTADDVVYTVQFAQRFKAPDLYNFVKRVAKVEKTGDLSLTMDLYQPWSGVFHVLLSKMYILPRHIWEGVEKEQSQPIQWSNPNPVGSGPFKFVAWEKGTQLVFDGNPDYFQPVNPKRLVRIRFENMEMLAAAIEKGEIDLQWGEPMNAALAGRASGWKNVKVVKLPNHGFVMVPFRCDKAPFNDPSFMKAIEYCTPRDLIRDRVYPGISVKAVSPVPQGNKAWHNPKVFDIAVPFDPAKGREILKRAGYEWDGEGNLCYPR